jgi:hypothetical protein
MNENQLSSWRPRRPSAGLRRRILNLAGQSDELPSARWLWSGLAPTIACTLFTLLAWNHGVEGLDAKLPMGLILSNQNNVAYATGGAETAQNHLAVVTFDSTNRSSLGSSIRFTPTTNLTN